MHVPSKRTITRTMGKSASAPEVSSGRSGRHDRDKTQKPHKIAWWSSVIPYKII
jgi:hypothetical protein